MMDITDFITEDMYEEICSYFRAVMLGAPDDFDQSKSAASWDQLGMIQILTLLSVKPNDERKAKYASIITEAFAYLREQPEDEIDDHIGVVARDIIMTVFKETVANPTVADEDQVGQIKPEDIEQIWNRE